MHLYIAVTGDQQEEYACRLAKNGNHWQLAMKNLTKEKQLKTAARPLSNSLSTYICRLTERP